MEKVAGAKSTRPSGSTCHAHNGTPPALARTLGPIGCHRLQQPQLKPRPLPLRGHYGRAAEALRCTSRLGILPPPTLSARASWIQAAAPLKTAPSKCGSCLSCKGTMYRDSCSSRNHQSTPASLFAAAGLRWTRRRSRRSNTMFRLSAARNRDGFSRTSKQWVAIHAVASGKRVALGEGEVVQLWSQWMQSGIAIRGMQA